MSSNKVELEALELDQLNEVLNWVNQFYPETFNQDVRLLEKVKRAALEWMRLDW